MSKTTRKIIQYVVIAPLKVVVFLLLMLPVFFIMFADFDVAEKILDSLLDFTILE